MGKRTCTIEGCDNKEVARGWCNKHYLRWGKHGDPLGGAPSPKARKSVDYPDGTRDCLGCGKRQPLDWFDRDKNASGGRRSRCKACRSAHMGQYYLTVSEHRKSYARQHRLDNEEQVRAQEAARYQRDREKRIELATEITHRRRQRAKLVPFERGVTRAALRKRHGDGCCYCGITMSFVRLRKGQYAPNLATIEHITPISKGGAHTFANTTLACWECNIRRGNRGVIQDRSPSGPNHPRVHRTKGLDQAAS